MEFDSFCVTTATRSALISKDIVRFLPAVVSEATDRQALLVILCVTAPAISYERVGAGCLREELALLAPASPSTRRPLEELALLAHWLALPSVVRSFAVDSLVPP